MTCARARPNFWVLLSPKKVVRGHEITLGALLSLLAAMTARWLCLVTLTAVTNQLGGTSDTGSCGWVLTFILLALHCKPWWELA